MIRGTVAAAAVALVAVTLSSSAQAAPTLDPAPQVSAGKGDGRHQRLVGIESLPAADQARQRAQEPLLNLNNQVYDLTSQSYDAHFAGAQLDVENNALILYWAGEVPAELGGLSASAAKSGITLSIQPAKFSRKQLMAAAEQVMPTAEVPGTINLATDGSGITVAAGDLPAILRGERLATAAESRLLQRIADTRSRTGVPVNVVNASPTESVNVSRFADQSPYWAGAVIRSQVAGSCTSGFSMYASEFTSTRFTLTVAHCAGYSDDQTIYNGAWQPMGRSDFIHEFYDNSTAYDLGVVRLNSGKFNAPYIYYGDNSQDGWFPVVNYASAGIPAGGNYCVFGTSYLGQNCHILSGGQIYNCESGGPYPRCVYRIRFTPMPNYALIWCEGDSGGPIFYYGGGGVIAAGLVSTGDGGECSRYGGASVVATAVNQIPGLRVLTTSSRL